VEEKQIKTHHHRLVGDGTDRVLASRRAATFDRNSARPASARGPLRLSPKWLRLGARPRHSVCLSNQGGTPTSPLVFSTPAFGRDPAPSPSSSLRLLNHPHQSPPVSCLGRAREIILSTGGSGQTSASVKAEMGTDAFGLRSRDRRVEDRERERERKKGKVWRVIW
jgi:hypothetical protein